MRRLVFWLLPLLVSLPGYAEPKPRHQYVDSITKELDARHTQICLDRIFDNDFKPHTRTAFPFEAYQEQRHIYVLARKDREGSLRVLDLEYLNGGQEFTCSGSDWQNDQSISSNTLILPPQPNRLAAIQLNMDCSVSGGFLGFGKRRESCTLDHLPSAPTATISASSTICGVRRGDPDQVQSDANGMAGVALRKGANGVKRGISAAYHGVRNTMDRINDLYSETPRGRFILEAIDRVEDQVDECKDSGCPRRLQDKISMMHDVCNFGSDYQEKIDDIQEELNKTYGVSADTYREDSDKAAAR